MAASSPLGATTLPAARAGGAARAGDLYRAVWRWHFYAGLLVLPFMVWLALTGALVLFKDEIDGRLHRALMHVPPATAPMRPASELVVAALAQQPGTLRSYTPPAAPGASAQVSIATAAGGERRTVYVDPYRAQVLGSLAHEGTVAWTIRKLHSLAYFGRWVSAAIEIAAGWAVLLVMTGVYLWWPRSVKRGRDLAPLPSGERLGEGPRADGQGASQPSWRGPHPSPLPEGEGARGADEGATGLAPLPSGERLGEGPRADGQGASHPSWHDPHPRPLPKGEGAKSKRGGVLSVRGRPAQRVFWRDLHAVTGILVGAVLLFLAVTGMPWSVWWGAQVNHWANGHNFGYPAGVRVQVPMSQARLSDDGTPAWSLAQARVPLAVDGPAATANAKAHADHEEHAGHGGSSGADGHEGHGDRAQADGAARTPLPGMLSLDDAVARFAQAGLAPGYTVQLPQGPRGVYTGSVYPDDLSYQRVIHLDAYSGRVLLDMGFADYGPMGRALEWGINVHMGQQWGRLNQWGLALACAAIVLLCVSAAVMWLKRRPTGRLGIPPLPSERRLLYGVLALLAIGGLIFPLVGASMAAMAGFDWWMQQRQSSQSAAATTG